MNSRKSKSFFLMLLAFVLLSGAGCAFKKDDPKEATPAAPTAEDVADELERKKNEQLQKETISAEDFTFELLEDKAPNKYSVKVTYPQKNGLTVHLVLNDEPVETTAGTPILISVLGGSELNFRLIAYNSNGVMVLNSIKKIPTPSDLVISDTVVLNKDTNWKLGRLYLNDDSIVQTKGFPLSIEANKIFARPNAKIMNFSSNEVWGSSQHKMGGAIVIRAKEAAGYLMINLTGAKGKNGRSGLEIENLIGIRKATDGYDGNHGEWDGDEDCTEDRYSGQTRCGIINLRCVSQPTNGEDGEDGPNGVDGENGADGGDTGNLFAQIDNHVNFTLKVSLKPGMGGLGGQGAPGKAGGKGGKAGALDQQRVCKPASNGKDGAPGKPGRTGQVGQPGKVGTIELNGLKNAIIE
ncbi:hypothetical protein [Bdellovibrio sp.]|uniref:hypothetical protein n=1 Tax=Bdellovibrio sp. TaxID=28201 RepID=UPI003221904F